MRKLYLRVAAMFALALIFSLVAMYWISGYVARRTNEAFFGSEMTLEVQRAERIYDTGGSKRLAEFLAETSEVVKGEHYLSDATGRDLVSGADLSPLLPRHFSPDGRGRNKNGLLVASKSSPDGKYRLFVIAVRSLAAVRLLPYFLLVALTLALLGGALSVGIMSPLHHFSVTVDRFGRGQLSARVEGDRKDEFGKLGRSFNSMADRIEGLLTAQRRLLQDVAHELRSPLARLSFAVQLMIEAPDPETASNCRQEVERLSELVSSLMEVSSAEGDPASRKMLRVAMPDLVRKIAADCGVEMTARDVGIDVEIHSSAAVDGDPELLRRAIENVLRNAIRFEPPGSRVSITVEEKDRNLIVRIRDHGPGTPSEFLTRIFDPFFQVEESRDASRGGAGLGLSIARRAVLLHHGEITAENSFPGLQVNISIPCI